MSASSESRARDRRKLLTQLADLVRSAHEKLANVRAARRAAFDAYDKAASVKIDDTMTREQIERMRSEERRLDGLYELERSKEKAAKDRLNAALWEYFVAAEGPVR
jgi:hypothetical protein